MTEREVQRFFWRSKGATYRVLLPNYTPLGWWECDLFGVTKAGYFHEFEIKLTMADFRKDSKKAARSTWKWENGQRIDIPGVTKHSMIGQTIGPSRFWYVVGPTMDVAAELPVWAGLQMFNPRGFAEVVRPAPQIHGVKIDDKIVRHALSVCYYRYWNERQHHDNARRDLASRVSAEVTR